MRQSTVSAPPVFFLPVWARIAIAGFRFPVAALQMWKEFFRFDWVAFLCLGSYYPIYVPMQKGEGPNAYFSKPRPIVSFGLIIAVVVAALQRLDYRFTKRCF
jgi:hypothetical protein